MFTIAAKRNGFAGLTAAVMLLASACSQPESFVKNKIDSFEVDTIDNYKQAKSLLQADYVISVDFSYSMSGGCNANSVYNCTSPKITRLFDSLDSFAANLASAGIDYRIGFVRGSKQSTTMAADTDFISGLVVTSDLGSSLTQLIRGRLGPVGKPLEGNVTSVVETTAKVLANRGGTFLRDSAQLVTLFVTDNDDTEESAQSYRNAIRSTKSDSSYVSARAVLAGTNPDCYTDPSLPEVYGEAYGSNVANVVNLLSPADTNKISCIMDNFSSILNNVARKISRQTKRFKLQVPNPDPETIKVYINGTLQDETFYSYEANTNEIVFNDAKKPDPDAALRIEYDQNYVLTSRPAVDTIEVRFNNSVVGRSETNGWSYDAAMNRIVLNGAAKPVPGTKEGAKIQVMYKLGNGI